MESNKTLPKSTPYIDFTNWKKKQREESVKDIISLTAEDKHIIPLTFENKNIIPLTVNDDRIIPLTADNLIDRQRCVPLDDPWTKMCNEGEQ